MKDSKIKYVIHELEMLLQRQQKREVSSERAEGNRQGKMFAFELAIDLLVKELGA